MKVFQVIECAKELSRYLKSTDGLSKEAISLMVPDSIKLDEEAANAEDKITAIQRKQIDIIGEHNIGGNGVVRSEVINSLSDTARAMVHAYANEIEAIVGVESQIVLNDVKDELIIVADDAIAYKTVKKMYRDLSKSKNDK